LTAIQIEAPTGYALGSFAAVYGGALFVLARQGQKAAERRATTLRPALTGENEDGIHESICQSRFLGELVQELRPPLNTILGFAEILQSPAAQDLADGEVRVYQQTLLDSSRNVSAFVSELSDLVRIDHGKFHLLEQEVDAAELAEIAMKLCREAAEAADVVVLVNVVEGVELRCDSARIRQALVCLVTRAVKVSPAGGIVRVSFSRTPEGGLAILINDRGARLAQSLIDRIFEPDLPGQGMNGLGLPIARRIAMLHAGETTIECAPGAGTTARLILPACRVSWNSGEGINITRAA
jgi:two-component system cell cycle sensor histidine kinase PleC